MCVKNRKLISVVILIAVLAGCKTTENNESSQISTNNDTEQEFQSNLGLDVDTEMPVMQEELIHDEEITFHDLYLT